MVQLSKEKGVKFRPFTKRGQGPPSLQRGYLEGVIELSWMAFEG